MHLASARRATSSCPCGFEPASPRSAEEGRWDFRSRVMSLSDLHVQQVRCIEAAELALHPGFNLVWGSNGAGKTSLLEAVFLLGRGRSFRTRHSEQLIRRSAQRLTVFGRAAGPIERAVGFAFDRDTGVEARVDGLPVKSLADLTRAVPVQVIDPGIHKLIEEGSHRRRRWLDWAVFHVEHDFGAQWYRYSRTLRQRNAALKTRAADARPWERDLVTAGEQVARARRTVLHELEQHWRHVVLALDCPRADLEYVSGWPEGMALADALERARARDQMRQTTTVGPHRADIRLSIDGKPARDVLSRGQQKLMAAALSVAQLRLLKESSGIVPTLLLDDPAAELDASHLAAFVEQISALGCQLVATALQPVIQGFEVPDRVFHVEQGRVRPV